jgi:hypothetical protein
MSEVILWNRMLIELYCIFVRINKYKLSWFIIVAKYSQTCPCGDLY